MSSLLFESNKQDNRQFGSNLTMAQSRKQDIDKINWFRRQCAAYDQLARRLGLGFIFGLPDGIWKEREYLFLRYMS
jgi:hypothetical protein